MRFTRGDVRDHIVSSQNRSRASVVALTSDAVPKIDFREIFGIVRFSTFATVPPVTDVMRQLNVRFRLVPNCRHSR